MIVAILHVVLTFTRWGLHTVAVGGNRLGAAEAGVRVRLVLIRNFVLCARCAGLVGILEAVRTGARRRTRRARTKSSSRGSPRR